MKVQKFVKLLILLYCVFLTACVNTHEVNTNEVNNKEMILKAQSLFKEYRLLSDQFSNNLVNCYSNDAVIHMVVIELNTKKNISYSGKEFKDLLIKVMPTAKQRNDIDKFSEEKYKIINNNRVMITANRYSTLYKNNSPYSAVVGPNEKGDWLIWEENIQFER